ncbi:MAG: MOSC N-terminal beta barrel domain-containing protein [Burkholderiaceae bacterium]|nr:MOSC N-terminal beta barrel domain-containing protein [Burkholderiaceae bacterium]
MPLLTELKLYPIKSCAGIALQRATVTRFGLMSAQVYDRQWMVVDHAGNFLTQREIPQMACIVPRLGSDALEVQAPGMPTLHIPLRPPDPADATSVQVTVWDDALAAFDCGQEAAAWFSQALGTVCRLARFDPRATRAINNQWTGGRDVQTHFADGYPMLLISEASLADLNRKLAAQARPALPMNRFRPNIVIAGIEAFEEDYAAVIHVGGAQLQPIKPCPRCSIPAVDQATGLRGPDPLDILQSYRANPKLDGGIAFGMNVILLEGENQVLEIGQEVEIELAF